MLVSLLCIMKSGSAYVPLDLQAPAARLADVLQQCGNPLVVSTTGARRTVPWVAENDIVYVDRLTHRQPALTEPVPVGAPNLIDVIFTSAPPRPPTAPRTEH